MQIVEKYARLWPREVFDYRISNPGKKPRYLAKRLEVLQNPGVYVLYRDDVPYYIGKAGGWLWQRLVIHARKPDSRYSNYWNYFSVFVIHDAEQRDAVESILIAAFPTANSSRPKIQREFLPASVLALWRENRDIVRSRDEVESYTEGTNTEEDEL